MIKQNRKSRLIAAVMLVAVLGLAQGCTLAKISGRGAIPIMFNNPPTRVQLVRSVEVKKMRAFDWTASFDVSEVLGDVIAMTDADAIRVDVVRVRDEGGVVSLPPAGTEPVASADSVDEMFAAKTLKTL